MSEPVEVRLARVEEQLKFMVKEAEEARNARKNQYESIEALRASIDGVVSSMVTMDGKVTDVNTKLAGQAPTIEEFITIKHKVVGAGKMGRWLWTVGAFLIGIAYSSREHIIQWLSKQ